MKANRARPLGPNFGRSLETFSSARAIGRGGGTNSEEIVIIILAGLSRRRSARGPVAARSWHGSWRPFLGRPGRGGAEQIFLREGKLRVSVEAVNEVFADMRPGYGEFKRGHPHS